MNKEEVKLSPGKTQIAILDFKNYNKKDHVHIYEELLDDLHKDYNG